MPHTWGLFCLMAKNKLSEDELAARRDAAISMSGFWAIPKIIQANTYLSDCAKMVYSVLWTRKNADNIAWPSQEYIAEQVGKSTRTIKRVMKELETVGLIYKQKRGLGRTNIYGFVSREVPNMSLPEVPTLSLPEVPNMAPLYNVSEDSNIRILPASPKKARGTVSNKTKTMHREDSRQFSGDDSYLPSYDPDTGERVKAVAKSKASESMMHLLTWAAKRRGFAFTNNGKQFAAMKLMKTAGIGPMAIRNRWIEMESDQYWRDKGFDFVAVANSFDRRR